MHLSAYNPDFGSLVKRPEVVDQLHKIGVIIFTWTPDTAENWTTLKKLGVDGIITNKATQLQGWVSAIKQMEGVGYSMADSLDTTMDMPVNQDVFESSDAKIVITSNLVSSYNKADSNFIIARHGADLADFAL